MYENILYLDTKYKMYQIFKVLFLIGEIVLLLSLVGLLPRSFILFGFFIFLALIHDILIFNFEMLKMKVKTFEFYVLSINTWI